MNTSEAAAMTSQANAIADELLMSVVLARLSELPDAIEVDVDAI